MAKRSHAVLHNWYKNFAKELYEKANIDITRKEDLGRIKNFYFTLTGIFSICTFESRCNKTDSQRMIGNDF